MGFPAFVADPAPDTERAPIPPGPPTEIRYPAFAPGATPAPYAPYPGTPHVAAPPPRRPRAETPWARVAVTIAIAGALASLAVVGAVSLLGGASPRDADDPSPSPSPAFAPSSAPRPTAAARGASGHGLRDLSNDALHDRLTAQDWEITSRTVTDAAAIASVTYGIKRAGRYGSVTLYRYANESLAAQTEASLKRSPDFVVVREGGTLLMVVVAQDAAAARQLAASLGR